MDPVNLSALPPRFALSCGRSSGKLARRGAPCSSDFRLCQLGRSMSKNNRGEEANSSDFVPCTDGAYVTSFSKLKSTPRRDVERGNLASRTQQGSVMIAKLITRTSRKKQLSRDHRTRMHRAVVQPVTDRSCASWASQEHGFALHEALKINVVDSSVFFANEKWLKRHFLATAPFGVGCEARIDFAYISSVPDV